MTRSRCRSPKDTELEKKEPQIEEIDGAFSYTQKFFHISDGNLYSVFSPLQGRSYGVKPSFLRRQRCMGHQRGGRGHKNSRKLLKFHNFIPSESVISEREDSHEIWKVHGECRLREEHGTKQIMVTNWSHSAACPPSGSEDAFEDSQLGHQAIESSPGLTPDNYEADSKFAPDDSQSLPGSSVPKTVDDLPPMSDGDRKHRRKPIITKRVVPYSQYLSMVDECPLDLTCHSKQMQEVNPTTENTNDTCSYDSGLLSTETSISEKPLPNYFGKSLPGIPIFLQTPPEPTTMQFSPQPCSTLESLLTSNPQSIAQYHQHQEKAVLGECLSEDVVPPRAPKVSRKPSHRTIIRKKLEDTFRQNGFLVKTKQVSDGDATFCKFKQLRKYTRYYLKSWHQHLPEEVHKLWKGFLPPKAGVSSGKKEN